MLIFILDYRNYIRQKTNSSSFFITELKMGHKAVETTHNINNAFGPGTTNQVQRSGGSGSSVREP